LDNAASFDHLAPHPQTKETGAHPSLRMQRLRMQRQRFSRKSLNPLGHAYSEVFPMALMRQTLPSSWSVNT
jgi:hypothetical protein